jgi:hypothetical protein
MAAGFILAMAAACITFASASAQTQIVASNSSGCDILLTFADAAGATSGPYLVTSGSGTTTINLPSGFVPVGVEDFNGRTDKFTGTPAPGCTGCVPLAAQGGAGFCCVTVCYDSGAGALSISSCGPC